MDLFEDIIRETFLINESVTINGINDAINGLHPVWITYDDERGGDGKNRRLIYPVAYGLTSKGNPVVRAFQPSGSSKRGLTTPPNNREYPKWKYFRVDRIKFWRMVSSKTFDGKTLEGFNEEGDNSMSIVYTIAPIGNAKQLTKQKPEIGYKPITKQDVENIPTEDNVETQQQEPESQQTTVQPKEQPKRKYSARQIINNILSRIKNTFTKKKNNVDNSQQTQDINNKNLTVQDTEPVTKQDVSPNVSQKQTTTTTEKPSDEPITKNDVNQEETVENNPLTNKYKDMMSRWNNLEK